MVQKHILYHKISPTNQNSYRLFDNTEYTRMSQDYLGRHQHLLTKLWHDPSGAGVIVAT